MLLLGGFTRYSATVWETFPGIVEASAHKAPTSARAQAQYATQLFNAQRYDDSLHVIERAIENIASDHPLLLVNRLIIRCQIGVLSASDFKRVADMLSDSFYDPRSIRLYTALTSSVVSGKCPEVSLGALRTMFENMLLVPQNTRPATLSYSQLNYFVGFVHVYAGEPDQAVASFEESLRARPGSSHAMIMAAHLATGEFYDEALYFSDLALLQLDVEQQGIVGRERVTESDIHEFRRIVHADIEAARKGQADAPPAQ
jgi:tetratricopeptide (TPR) repeat protein